MAKYTVADTHIFHGSTGGKEAALHAPGDTIELTDAEAQALGERVTPLAGEKKKEK